MSIPTIIFGMIIASLYGAAFHFWRGGGLGKLFLYLLLGWAGFWVGDMLGRQLGWSFASLGPLHLGMATIGSGIFLMVGHWLSLVQVERK